MIDDYAALENDDDFVVDDGYATWAIAAVAADVKALANSHYSGAGNFGERGV